VTHVIKARSRQGTNSLDLTIPVKVANEMNIKEGDVFVVQTCKNKDGKLEITYTRIYNANA
jgi:antitoxin component of MazEF toxin-antitoxin module